MIKLIDLVEYNAARKNKTRRISKTHKDVAAYIAFRNLTPFNGGRVESFLIDAKETFIINLTGNIKEYPFI